MIFQREVDNMLNCKFAAGFVRLMKAGDVGFFQLGLCVVYIEATQRVPQKERMSRH